LKNYKITIEYEGTDFCGWQIQANSKTIQEELQKAIKTILREEVNLIGAGRTDSGVHALGQTANFRYTGEIDMGKFIYSVNAILPRGIAISRGEEVLPEFHARFDAKKRVYLYIITNKKSPFYWKYSYFYNKEVDVRLLNEFCKEIVGKRDFRSFAKEPEENQGTDCAIHSAHWRITGDFTIFSIEANRFLRGMVRTIVGTLLEMERKRMNRDYLSEIIEKRERESAGMAVPPQGLFLYKVRY